MSTILMKIVLWTSTSEGISELQKKESLMYNKLLLNNNFARDS